MATPKKSGNKGAKGGKRVSSSAAAGITFPVGRVGRFLRKGKYTPRTSATAAVMIASALEYLTTEVITLAGKLCKGKSRVTPRAICLAVRNDADLGALLQNVTIARGGVLVQKQEKKAKKAKKGKKGGKGKKAAAKGEKKAAKKSSGKKKGGKKAKKSATQTA